MRAFVAALLIATPFVAAQAQSTRIPDAELKSYFESCVEVCDQNRGYAYCADKCGCMTNEIGRLWDVTKYTERVTRLKANPQDPDVHGQMGRLARACVPGAGTPNADVNPRQPGAAPRG